MKFPENVDRQVFLTWAVPLVIAHLALSLVGRAGVPGMGALDTVAILFLAGLIARRFRNIGWPGWIGASFLIATMLVIPLGVVAYAVANNLPPSQFETLINTVGLVSAIANLVLLIVAGAVKGNAPADPLPADPVVVVAQSPDEASPSPMQPAAPAEPRRPDALVVGAVAMFAVAVLGLIVALLFRQQPSSQALLSPPATTSAPDMNSAGSQMQSNGLTKNTNDFLRQMSQQPRGATNR